MSIEVTDYARKIAGLLAKAEDPAVGDAEAKALLDKAQDLCTRYSIDEAMVNAAKNGDAPEPIIREEIPYQGTFRKAKWYIGAALAKSNDCRVLIRRNHDRTLVLVIIGFEGDVRRVKMMDASVQIQAQQALLEWAKEQKDWLKSLAKKERWRNRREFLTSFAAGLEEQLGRAKGEAVKAAEAEREDKESSSVEIVLRDKRQRVDDWVDKTYGKLRKSGGREYRGSVTAASAGRKAGRTADLGGSRVAGGAAGALGQ